MTSAAEVVVIGAGQSGLAAARALQARGISPVVLEAGDRAAGSWPRYYDSLQAFSPARFNSMPGMAFPGDPDRYPARDEIADYLDSYAAALGVQIHTGTRVAAVGKDDRDFVVVTADGRRLRAAGIVAASGSFASPYRPAFPGQDSFTGELTHVAGYRNPAPYAGKRVVVVGAGDSAAQVANELAPVARVTVAARHPLRFIRSGSAGKTSTTGSGRPGSTRCPPNGWTRSPAAA
jgi:putative flavoprotein involved in K+ transport